MSVAVHPGQTALTRIRWGRSSPASNFVSAFREAFETL
jgi:hypothetical protein